MHPFMYVTSDWKRGRFRSRSLFPKKTFQRFQSSIIRMTNSVFFSHLPMLGFFALACPFQVDVLSFFYLCTWYLLEVCLCALTLCPSSFTLAFCVTVHLFLSSWLFFFPFTCMLIILSCFFLVHSNAVVLPYSSVALPGMRKDIVSVAVVWFCAENSFLASSLPSASSSLHKRRYYESLLLVLCFSHIETEALYLLSCT